MLLFLEQILQESKVKKQISATVTVVPNYLTHDEIAQLTGTSRQTVTTLLNEMKEEGILICTRKEFQFINIQHKYQWLAGSRVLPQ